MQGIIGFKESSEGDKNGSHERKFRQRQSYSGRRGKGVPRPRAEWIARRKADNQDGNFSQMHYARKGLITEEMIYVAEREKISAELVREK